MRRLPLFFAFLVTVRAEAATLQPRTVSARDEMLLVLRRIFSGVWGRAAVFFGRTKRLNVLQRFAPEKSWLPPHPDRILRTCRAD